MTTTSATVQARDAVAAGSMLRRDIPAGLLRQVDVDGDAREFTAIGVPYGEVIEHYFGRETFDPGSVEGSGDAILLYRHGEVIGVILDGVDVADGHQINARISATALGLDAWTLVKDRAIRSVSIGFIPREYRVETDGDGNETIHWTRVEAREFSLVPFPAYAGAAVDASTLRHHQHSTTSATERTEAMTTDLNGAITRADLTPIEDTLDDLTRSIDLIKTGGHSAPSAGLAWRSMGEFLKAIADGDTDAADFHRAYTGSTSADDPAHQTFVGDYIRLIQDRRRIVNLFTTAPLPAEGMTVDYVKVAANTVQVTEQANEGDDLAYGKVTLEDASAPVRTFGGWTELSLQRIKRSTVPSLDTTLKALGLAYGAATDAAVAAKVAELETANAANAVTLGAAATAQEWLDAIVDVALAMEDDNLALSGLLVTPARFKALSALKDGDNRLMSVYGSGVNQVGELNLTAVAGNLAGVTVHASTKVTDGVFFDKVAVEFRESAGAPAQLQDENVINLSKAFSVYGFASVLAPFPNGIIPIDDGAA